MPSTSDSPKSPIVSTASLRTSAFGSVNAVFANSTKVLSESPKGIILLKSTPQNLQKL